MMNFGPEEAVMYRPVEKGVAKKGERRFLTHGEATDLEEKVVSGVEGQKKEVSGVALTK